MDALFAAHSGIRYLVLFAGLVALVWFAYGTLAGRPFVRPSPAFLTGFIGLLDVQILLGIALVIGGRRPPAVWGHLAVMLTAAVVVHVLAARHKRRPRPASHRLPLLAVAITLALVVVGILAIGRPIL
jgi:uncharacterized membrane protein YphA (DoxX/SURF4 family)